MDSTVDIERTANIAVKGDMFFTFVGKELLTGHEGQGRGTSQFYEVRRFETQIRVGSALRKERHADVVTSITTSPHSTATVQEPLNTVGAR
jgi:hypothetical protein